MTTDSTIEKSVDDDESCRQEWLATVEKAVKGEPEQAILL